MHPIFIRIGQFPIHWYGVFMALAFLSGFASWVVLGRSRGRSFEHLSDMLFWIMVAGLLGGRLAYVLSDFGYFMTHPAEIIRVDRGGLIYYGGFIGGTLGLWWFARRHGERLLDLLDFGVTSVPLAHAFGRIGCLMNGCCYGRVWDGVLAVRFPTKSHAWCEHVNAGLRMAHEDGSMPVHPVQVYESAFNILVYIALLFLYKRRRKEGSTMAAYLMIYPVGRFLLEFFRGDLRLRWLNFSVAQWLSIALFVSGWILLAWVRKRGREA